mgnify:CR=1 FL=1
MGTQEETQESYIVVPPIPLSSKLAQQRLRVAEHVLGLLQLRFQSLCLHSGSALQNQDRERERECVCVCVCAYVCRCQPHHTTQTHSCV